MIATNFKYNNLQLNYYDSFVTYEKKLDSQKLKLLLTSLGFNPMAIGTVYITEELEFLYNNGITSIKKLKQAYIISAKIHNVDIQNVQWNIEYSIESINRYSNEKLFREIF